MTHDRTNFIKYCAKTVQLHECKRRDVQDKEICTKKAALRNTCNQGNRTVHKLHAIEYRECKQVIEWTLLLINLQSNYDITVMKDLAQCKSSMSQHDICNILYRTCVDG